MCSQFRSQIHALLRSLLLMLAAMTLWFSTSLSAAQDNQPVLFYDDNKAVAIEVELFEFESEQQRQRAVALAKQLRCPQCQNQNLVESNSPVAKDLRLRVYQMVKAGDSDQEVVDFMTERFGEFVLYAPSLSGKTYVLWFMPLILLVSVVIWAVVLIRRRTMN